MARLSRALLHAWAGHARGLKVRAGDLSFSGGRSRSCGIVGAPNIGKSTLFNAMTATQAAQAANYPFCTIDPNIGRVAIPDLRLAVLADAAKSAKIIGAQLEFVDIAGLVKGASEGAGLGNKFLGNIRQVSVIVQLLRCFEDPGVEHVDGSVDPVRDFDMIETELLLADLQTLGKKRQKTGAKDAQLAAQEAELALRLIKDLDNGIPARDVMIDEEEAAAFRGLGLLTGKPLMLLCNVSEQELQGNAHTQAVQDMLAKRVCASLEAEVSQMEDEDKLEMLQTYGLDDTGLARVIRESNALLGLSTFYTVGPQEARAWSYPSGMLVPQAAGIIHSDMERGFIKAETISYSDYLACGGESGAKEAGKLRLEGKEYKVADGDIFHFKFNVTK
ncbi:GTP-binding protein YchF [Baffinella frigidus]|nr:GTP-binding protein YchF [Cryptophyta sp. CCMP2293]